MYPHGEQGRSSSREKTVFLWFANGIRLQLWLRLALSCEYDHGPMAHGP